MNIQALPDKGEKLLKQIQVLEEALSALTLSLEQGKWLCPRTQEFLEPDKRFVCLFVFLLSHFDEEYIEYAFFFCSLLFF